MVEETGMSTTLDGIWGMNTGFTNAEPPLFINNLKASSQITSKIFAFKFMLNTSTSTLDVGVVNSGSYTGDIAYMPALTTDFWWTNTITGVKFSAG